MSASTKVQLSPIIDVMLLRQQFSNVVLKNAKIFQVATHDRMIKQIPQGKNVEKREGKGFKRFHRASARGQRPQPDTLTLANAVQTQRTGDFSALVDIKAKINPENKESARDYAETLVQNLGRVIMTRDDVKIAERILQYDCERIADRIK
jgi:hypothetical protein